MRVIEVPASLDYRNVEALYRRVAGEDDTGPVLFDARRLRWIDPNGMLLLLAAGKVAARSGNAPRISLPARQDVTDYMDRMGFPGAAAGIFRSVTGGRRSTHSVSDVLLEITPVTTNSDVHDVVDRVQSRAGAILSKTLRYPPSAVVRFSVILSEVCQNIIEHAEAPGWVAAQAYNWKKRLGRQVAVIAVSDLGCGFRASLETEHAARFGDRWGDATALEAAFLMGLTRFADTGRGQGIQQIRKQVGRWQGILSIRSGTARIADIPDWSSRPPLEEELTRFPGSQINIILPEHIG